MYCLTFMVYNKALLAVKRRIENLLNLDQTFPDDSLILRGERGGSVVECRTPEREVRGSRPTAAVLCP